MTSGYKRPPMAAPAATMPIANARRRRNQVAHAVVAGTISIYMNNCEDGAYLDSTRSCIRSRSSHLERGRSGSILS
jgi:hypothetical protein